MGARRIARRGIAAVLVLLLSQPTQTLPAADAAALVDSQNTTLAERGCPNPCGYYDQLCCSWGQSCYTDSNGWPACGSSTPAVTSWPAYTTPAQSGHWQYWTTTWVETDRITKTSVYSSFIPYPTTTCTTTTRARVKCPWGQQPCGPICCGSWQFCAVEGQCAAKGTSRPYSTSYPGSYSQPLRVTSSGMSVVIASVTPTRTTTTFQKAVTTGPGLTVSTTSGSVSLSGGAIAGIVIGVIIAIIFLILLCLFLCFRAAWDTLLALFGIRRGRRRRQTIEIEEYRRHGSRANSRTWYGGRPGRPPPKKNGQGLGWGGVAASLGGLAVLLGLKRRYDRRKDEKSNHTASSGYSSYTDGSSDRRTRDTRDTRRSSRR